MKKSNETKPVKDPTQATMPKTVNKGWSIDASWPLDPTKSMPGEIFAYHEPDELKKLNVQTVKIMYFGKNKFCSVHLHRNKQEYFICALGEFEIEFILKNGIREKKWLKMGEKMFIPRMMPHRILGLENVNLLVEVSTLDKPEDSYRIQKGC